MPGIQLPIGIETVNPVPADYKYGPYASTAAAIAAIPQVLRFDGLTVKINGLGEYWWLAADLTNTGLIPKTGGGGSTAPVPITYAGLLVLQTGGTLSQGTTYKITDRDLGIYITAISSTEFNTRGVRSMLTPKFDAIINPLLMGIWFNWIDQWIVPLNVGDRVIWGGQVWESLTGTTGTAINDLTLDAVNWVLVPKGIGADINYGIVTHNIEYDVVQDLIIRQWDILGNIVGPVTQNEVTNFGFNPSSITNWLSFKDINYVWSGGVWGDWNVICYNNAFKYGMYNISNIDQLSGNLNIIRNNNFNYFKNIGTFEGALLENNYNCSFYNLEGSYFQFTNNNNNVTFHDCTLLPFTNCDATNNNKCLVTLCTGGVYISDSKNISYQNIAGGVCIDSENIEVNGPTTLGGITRSKNLFIGVGNYGAFTNVIFEDVQTIVPAGGDVTYFKSSVEKVIYQYVEFSNLLLPGVSQFQGRIIKPNTRLVEATIVSTYVPLAGTPTFEFGVETDAVLYMPATLVSTLLTTPQKINTISGILTVGKRFYLKITALSGSINGSGTPKLRAWVKMISY